MKNNLKNKLSGTFANRNVRELRWNFNYKGQNTSIVILKFFDGPSSIQTMIRLKR